jgi:NADPH-dependent 2,4-dienoyl-CoA reductase/sulfur reductase-like enzyme
VERRPARSLESVAIIGAGAAGAVAAETLRREGFQGRIVLFDAEPDAPYDRPNLSKDYLAGTAPEEWIPLHPPDFYLEKRIEFVRREVATFEAATRTVTLAGGAKQSFDSVLLAPGAEPVRLDIPMDGANVFYLRSLADSRAIIRRAESAKRAVIIGASFIGLEVAASLRHRGVDVHVVAPEDLPLARIMGDTLGTFIRDLHAEHGVNFHLGRTVRAMNSERVTLDDGTQLAADMIVIGVGVRPRLALAQAAGLAVDKGIAVNEFLETSVPGVFAAGDSARWPDPHSGERIRVEHWVVAERMGQTAARNMLGARQRFDAVPFFWSQHYDVAIAYVGFASSFDEAVVDGDPYARDCAVMLKQKGKLCALATIFRDRQSLETELAMERKVEAFAAARV